MKIANSQLNLSAEHSALRYQETQETLNGQQESDGKIIQFSNSRVSRSLKVEGSASRITLSDTAKQLLEAEQTPQPATEATAQSPTTVASAPQPAGETQESTGYDTKLDILRGLV
ncbi:MAG: hypothetical protein LBM56_04310, partial [Burkholderiaceae bacterium]|nr:hypothetical protein [Burkholderiaceae bacterium]